MAFLHMGWQEVALTLVDAYKSIVSAAPLSFQSFISLFFIVVLIVIYAVFVWKLDRLIATKNIFSLNLNQYNTSKHPFIDKFLATLLYFLEYIVILPIIILFSFIVFSIFLILVVNLELRTILFISAAVIATIRVLTYIPRYGETLAREIAKLLAFTLLAVALLTPGFFDIERIIGNIGKIGEFFSVILSYLLFIVILEVILRFFEFLLDLTGLKSEA